MKLSFVVPATLAIMAIGVIGSAIPEGMPSLINAVTAKLTHYFDKPLLRLVRTQLVFLLLRVGLHVSSSIFRGLSLSFCVNIVICAIALCVARYQCDLKELVGKILLNSKYKA